MNQNWQKNTILFLASQTISLFGSTLVQHAITWYITLRTQSGMMMTIAIICGFLPTFLLSPFAGVWADRYHRKTLIVLSDSLIAMATLVLAILFWIGYDAIWLLFAASAVRARVFGVMGMIATSMMPLGMLIFGPVADYIRIEWLLIGTGLLLVVQSLFMLGSKALVEAGRPVLEGE